MSPAINIEEEGQEVFQGIPAWQRCKEILPQNYEIRLLRRSDYDNGFLECLSQLTVVGNITREAFDERFNYIAGRSDSYYPIVIADACNRVVAAGTLLVERKFIRNCGQVGHVEDIVVHASQRGRNLGRVLLRFLKELALEHCNCYKVILDCEADKVEFYEKCDFKEKGRQMAHYRQ